MTSRRQLATMLSLPFVCLAAGGCGGPGTIDTDTTSTPVRFIVNHHGWPRPFWWPRVTEFAVGSEEDDLVWHLQATDSLGALTHNLAFVYGEAPPGFQQVYPPAGVMPKPLAPGRSYYVGATGPNAVYRVVFALPLSPEEAMQRRPPAAPPPPASAPSIRFPPKSPPASRPSQ